MATQNNHSDSVKALGSQVDTSSVVSGHIWKPTTNTLAVWKCKRCGAVGFDPHPLPKEGCTI